MSFQELRKSKGFSQKSLAEKAGVSVRTIQRMERGDTSLSAYTLQVVSTALHVEINELIPNKAQTSPGLEKSGIKWMNFSALTGLVLPLANFLFPLYLYYRWKKDKLVREQGKRILNFQFLWIIGTCIFTISTSGLLYTLFEPLRGGGIPIFIPIYLFALLLNLLVILQTSIRLNSQKPILPFIPHIF